MNESSQTTDSNKPEVSAAGSKGLWLFASLFVGLCLLPFVGMLWAQDSPALDDDSRSMLPLLVAGDNSVNLEYLQDLGTYFEDHFAYRNLAIDLNARLRAGLFKTSPTEQVIIGSQGWLFYGGTLDDFRASSPLDNREIFNITHNLTLMQGYTQAMGAQFVVAIAPNKNSLYPHFMPYYYLPATNESMSLLKESLASAQINYVDLFELFDGQDDVLYSLTDTHWTTEGALLASNNLLAAGSRGVASETAERQGAVIVGDIERMLYPVTAQTEASLGITTGTWHFTGGSVDVADDIVYTSSAEGEGVLLMFRDSFADTLIPCLAPEFARAEFTKMIPYNFTQIADLKPDVVIVERAQRQVRLLGEDPPFLYAPTAPINYELSLISESEASWRQDGDFRIIEGFVDEEFIDAQDSIFISIEGTQGEPAVYVPFLISISLDEKSSGKESLDFDAAGEASNGAAKEHLYNSPYGFRLFFNERTLPENEYTVKILVVPSESDTAFVVGTVSLKK
ncbi:MAG: hypothetical protein FWD27_01580 [Coriobacteriia bacterium]|nr:hypothetical protein [Coriobacteriia bacterium]